jgi:hypothetical protein
MNPARVFPALDFALAALAVLMFPALTSLSLENYTPAGSARSVRAGTGAAGLSDELAPPLLNHGGLAIALESAQHQHPVRHIRQDRLIELRQQRSAQRISWRH